MAPIRSWTWARRLKRVFRIDVETCEQRGGAVKVIACLDDSAVIIRILDQLAAKRRQQLPHEPLALPARLFARNSSTLDCKVATMAGAAVPMQSTGPENRQIESNVGRVRTTLRRLLPLLGVLAIAATMVVALRSPSLAREWDADVRVLAGVRAAEDGTVELRQVRDWNYTRAQVVDSAYFDASFNPNDIVDLWMYEQILDNSGLIAHTFLVFEFDESYGAGRYLGLSVETRREVGESYSILGGMLRAFEVTHIWASERDLVRRRVEFLDYPLTRYRLLVPAEIRARLFRKLAQETQALSVSPRWYHTALNNCTSSLIRYVNESEPGAIPLHYSYVLTGRTAAYLGRLGYLDVDSALRIDREFLASSEIR